ncbi:alpha/beta fold hydrolase [Sneathiella chinensis]|uniref:Alpha/beta hydrolase n=1 Tax=Sneathiella chinensis TaxID=349750 RepID=A0ABQ5U4L4_9PROT|nr:alpha/beta hydrolase [Sneathiella chinensis]GLQ06267.1 alpha/beta hydrolase [Sneathiella chinensis]
MKIDVKNMSLFASTGGQAFDPDKPTLVFLHGAAMDHTAWALQSRYFAHHGYNVFALDLPGHGKSDGPLPASIDEMADWVIAFLDAVGVEKAALAGHSMGSLTALSAAGRYPARVSHLVLIGTAFPMMVGEEFLNMAKANDPAAYRMMIDWSHARPSHMGASEVPGLWMIGNALRTVERAGDDTLYKGLSLCANYEGGFEAAAHVTCPALFILGDRDMMTMPRAAQKLIAAIPDAKTVMLTECGHMQMIEKADAVRKAMRDFL